MNRYLVVAALIVVGALAVGAQAPKKAYMLVQIDVTDSPRYGEYMKLTPGLIEKHGGRFIARGGRSETLEGTPARSRVVIVEFPSYERAQQFYSSAEYQAAKKLRDGAATAQFVLVEGM